MKALHPLLALRICSLDAFGAQAGERPPLPFRDWGACPFECCTYREWFADAPMPVFRRRDPRGPVAFRLARGERVVAITGVVVTHKAGIAKLPWPLHIGELTPSVEPTSSVRDAVVHVLRPSGEGWDLFWYQGRTYVGQTSDYDGSEETVSRLGVRSSARRDRPVYTWWAHIRDDRGRTGWTPRTDRFRNTDACG